MGFTRGGAAIGGHRRECGALENWRSDGETVGEEAVDRMMEV